MNGGEQIAVIIPTLATRERAPYLLAAIESVTSQAGVRAVPLVVANGPNADPDLRSLLARRRDLSLHVLDEPSLPAAIRAGRRLVATRFFSELDDDDLLLPGALAVRHARMARGDHPDVVVSNGIRRGWGIEELHITDIEDTERDPLRALLERNWLLPGSALFRSEAITPDVFAGMPKYLEWTFLGLALALRFRIAFLGEPTVVHHTDLPFSMDRSIECRIGRPAALGQLLSLPLPRDVSETIRGRIGEACHEVSDVSLRERRWLDAWRWHLRSLFHRRGWRYLAYTRHLLPLARSAPGSELY
jgi:hypothetical protein